MVVILLAAFIILDFVGYYGLLLGLVCPVVLVFLLFLLLKVDVAVGQQQKPTKVIFGIQLAPISLHSIGRMLTPLSLLFFLGI